MKSTYKKIHSFRKERGPFDLGLTTVILLFILGVGHAKDDHVCNTEACNEVANIFLKNMNQSVDPCDDFYQYACGNFARNSTLLNDKTEANYFRSLTNEINEKLNQTLSANITDQDYHALRHSKTFYHACMNSGNVRKEIQEVMGIVNNFGGWPSVRGSNWNETSFDWFKMTLKLQQLGYLTNSFLQVSFTEDDCIEISPYLEDKMTFNLATFSIMAGADQSLAYLDMAEVEQFRQLLSAVRAGSGQFQQKMSIRELQEKIPDINWLEYITAAGPFTVDENQTISVTNLYYTSNLTWILARKPKKLLANCILADVADNIMTFLNEELLETEHPDQTLRRCMKDIKEHLGIAISSVYLREYFDKNIQLKVDVSDIIRNLKEQYVDMFQKSTRMDDKLRIHALIKLNALRYQVGYSDEILDDQKVQEYYKNLKLDGNSYFDIWSRLQRFNNFVKNKYRDNRIWVIHQNIVQVNAVNQKGTTVSIPAGIMQGIFFNKDRPKYMNYGTLGSTIGHEIGHTFAPSIFPVNRDEYVPEYPLSNRFSYSNYTQTIRCITDMYNNYNVKEINKKINGRLTLDENFSDIVGLQAAYNAYKKWVEVHGEEHKLPGIERSSIELFWLSAATRMCNKHDPGSLQKIIEEDEHSLGEARVVNPFKNMPEFAKDYKCLPGTKMNPHQNERCPVF